LPTAISEKVFLVWGGKSGSHPACGREQNLQSPGIPEALQDGSSYPARFHDQPVTLGAKSPLHFPRTLQYQKC